MKYKFDNKPSESFKFRKKWLKKGYELVDITYLCDVKIQNHGWCNNFNEPDENIYHIQIRYRKECIANVKFDKMYVIDDNMYCIHTEPDYTGDGFIVYRKVPLCEKKKSKKR